MLTLREILLLEDVVTPTEISNAIENRKQVIVNYADEKRRATGKRLFEPYVYGVLSNGNQVVRGFQYNGSTYRGVPKWKLLRVDRIEGWSETDNTFNQPPRHRGWTSIDFNTSGDKQMQSIYSIVSFNDEEMSTDRLQVLRNKTRQLQQSNPVNIFRKDEPKKPSDIGDDISKQREMLKRNLEITKREKDAKGFRLSQNGIEVPQDDQPTQQVQNKSGAVQSMDADDDNFKRMLQRNMEITDKEKKKRGFSLSGLNPEDTDENIEPQKSEDEIMRDMIRRNLEITRKEKERRGFHL